MEENIPIVFDKSAVKVEYREFSIDNEVTDLVKVHDDAVQFWLHVCNMASPMGSFKHHVLATICPELTVNSCLECI